MEKFVMEKEDRKVLEKIIEASLISAVTKDYAKQIMSHCDKETGKTFVDAVIEDVIAASDWERLGEYNLDDVRFAVGRELAARLGA